MGVTSIRSIPRGAQVPVGARPARQGAPRSRSASAVQVMGARWSPGRAGLTNRTDRRLPPARLPGPGALSPGGEDRELANC